jgi:hypothetical protein
MAQDTNKMEAYSVIVDAKLRANSVFANIFNNRHDTIGGAIGGAVNIPVRTEATAGAYVTATGLAISNPATSYQKLLLDNDYAVNELIDGFMAAAVPDGMIAERLDSAGYALANVVDAALAADLIAHGTASSDTTALTKSNVYEKIVNDITTVKKAKVDPSKIWLAVTSDTYAKLIQSSEFIAAVANIEEFGAGFVGKLAGIPVYEAINLNGLTTGSGSSQKTVDYVVGNGDFCHFVDAWNVPVGVYDLADGAHIGCSAVQGRKAFGYKITQATSVIYHNA